MIQGTDERVRLTFELDGARIDLSGAVVYYRWKKNRGDADPPEIDKDSGTPADVTILPQVSPTLGQADVYLVPADTASLQVGWHYWDAWAVLASGKRYALLPTRIRLVDAVTDL